MWLQLLSVFGMGMIGLWEGIPTGFALRMRPLLTGLVSGTGSLAAMLLVLFLGERIRERLLRRRAPAGEAGDARRDRLIDRVWRRYGVVGLGLLGPGLIGSHLGTALGLSLGVPARRLLLWLGLGIVLWTVGLTVTGMLGTAGILRLMGR